MLKQFSSHDHGDKNYFHDIVLTHFSKTTAPQEVKLSSIIIFKLYKFGVNL